MGSPFVALVAALSTCGCVIVGDDRGLPDGSLVVDWTVKGTKAPRACSDNGAVTLDVIIKTADGIAVTEQQSDCESFDLSVQLPPNVYTIDGVLLDARGNPITTTVRDRLRVRPAEADISAVDFPADSFL